MEFTIAQIRDFAGDEQTFEKGEKLMKEKAIKSLDIDDFSSPEIIMVNANVVEGARYTPLFATAAYTADICSGEASNLP